MTKLEDQLAKIVEQINELRNVEVEFQGETITLDLSEALLYAYGYSAGITQGILARAHCKGDLQCVGKEALVLVELTVTKGVAHMERSNPEGYA